jgi:hypothetical protein
MTVPRGFCDLSHLLIMTSTALPSCRNATVIVFETPDGKAWELFEVDGQRFINQIPSAAQASTTSPAHVMRDQGLCNWDVVEPDQLLVNADLTTSINPLQSNLETWQLNRIQGDTLSGGEGFGWVAFIALGLLAITRGQSLMDARSRRRIDAQVASDVQALVTTGATAETLGIHREFTPESDVNSSEFTGNSLGIHPDSWPPKAMGPAYDPMEPEQPGEFDSFRRCIDQDGLSPQGNDVIKHLWGANPGKSEAYKKARKRRDDFAKRLNYYRYEEM